MLSIRAARRYRWRLAGGRLTADGNSLQFTPNPLERWRADTAWECAAEDVTGVRLRKKMWLVVETAAGAETFRVFRAAGVVRRFEEALQLTAKARDNGLSGAPA
jgi:hypothetical protein